MIVKHVALSKTKKNKYFAKFRFSQEYSFSNRLAIIQTDLSRLLTFKIYVPALILNVTRCRLNKEVRLQEYSIFKTGNRIKMWIDNTQLFFSLTEILSFQRKYHQVIPESGELMTVEYWKERVNQKTLKSKNGTGYWVKNNLASYEDVFYSEPLDATHVLWFKEK